MNFLKNTGAFLGSLLLAEAAFAQTVAPAAAAAPDLTALIASVDVSTITAAVLTVGGLGVAIRLAWVGVKYVRSLTKSS